MPTLFFRGQSYFKFYLSLLLQKKKKYLLAVTNTHLKHKKSQEIHTVSRLTSMYAGSVPAGEMWGCQSLGGFERYLESVTTHLSRGQPVNPEWTLNCLSHQWRTSHWTSHLKHQHIKIISSSIKYLIFTRFSEKSLIIAFFKRAFIPHENAGLTPPQRETHASGKPAESWVLSSLP